MIFEKKWPCLWILEPGFWIYGWIRLLGPSRSNVVPRPLAPGSINFLRLHNFTGFFSWFLRKWGLACENWSQGSGLRYGSTCLLGPSSPNVVSRLRAARSISFLMFHNFIGFISWFLRKWDLVCENWSQGSGLLVEYIFWAQVAQMYFLGPWPQGK